jgi:hypothetical protein
VESVVSADDPKWNNFKNINIPPSASFSIMPPYPTTVDDIVLVSTSTDPDGDALTYQWYLDDWMFSTDSRTELQIASQGTRQIKLVVTDAKGATVSAVKSVNVRFKPEGKISNKELKQGLAIALLLALLSVVFLLRRRKKKRQKQTVHQAKPVAEPKTINKESVTIKPEPVVQSTDDKGWVTLNRFCTNCGNSLTAGDQFCNSCGQKV